jgi:hypothetical protein
MSRPFGLDRLLPTRKNEPVICEMAPLEKAADAVTAADEAAKLAKVIGLYVNSLEAR